MATPVPASTADMTPDTNMGNPSRNDGSIEHADLDGQNRLTSITHDFYPGGRHEMLHELNRRDVIAKLLTWISGIVERATG